MSYATLKGKMGRQPVYIVEIDLDFCRNTYGTGFCTAALGVTGTAKCFNTRKPCQDPAHYALAAGWDPAKAGPGVTVDLMDATSTLGDAVLSIDGHATGKHYAEIAIGTPNVVGCWVGIAEIGIDLANVIGSDAHGWGYYGYSGVTWTGGGATTAYGATFTTGDVIGIAHDGDAGTVEFFKNGVSQGVAFTGLAGTKYLGFNGANTMSVATIRTTEADFDYHMPDGYSAWSVVNRLTYRFSNIVLPPSSDPAFVAIPAVSAISLAPTVIDPANGIGKRASVVVSFKDFKHSDAGIDPYLSERGYDSSQRGTFWTKLLARTPYYQNRPIRVMVGYVEDGKAPDLANFQTRLYLIQMIDGPDAMGAVTITAQDPLKLLDDKRAMAPLANTGVLYADILAGAGTATLTPTGIGDQEYPAAGTLVMGNELAGFTRAGDTITFTARGTNGTTADAHNLGDTVQVVASYTDQRVTDVLYDLLVTKAGISTTYIDRAAWDAEADTWLSDYQITTLISKPVGVNQLVGELAQQCLFYIWWDERTHLINFKAIHPTHNETIPTIDETSNVIADSQSRTEAVKDRKTQVWVAYGQRNPTVDLNKPYNYTAIKVTVDPAAEGAPEYGDSRIEVIWSRWLDANSSSQAEKLGLRRLNRYRDSPKVFKFKLDAKDSDLWTGDVVEATIRSIVDFTGEPLPTAMQILAVNETVPGSEYEYSLQDTQFRGRYAFWAPDAEPDYTAATAADLARYAWWADDAGLMSDTADGYKYV